MDYQKEFKRLKAYFNIDNKDIVNITGLSEASIKRSTSPKNFSKYFKLTIWVFKKMLKEEIKER